MTDREPIHLAGERSHGEPFTADALRQGSPPTAVAVDGPGVAAVGPAGASGPHLCSLQMSLDGSVWDRLVGIRQDPGDMAELIELLEVAPVVRSTALMFALERSRLALEGIVSSAPTETPVEITAADLLVLTRAVMARLR
jgi:hypothetical protein